MQTVMITASMIESINRHNASARKRLTKRYADPKKAKPKAKRSMRSALWERDQCPTPDVKQIEGEVAR